MSPVIQKPTNGLIYFVNETEEVKAFYTLKSGDTPYPFIAQAPKSISLPDVTTSLVDEPPHVTGVDFLADILSPTITSHSPAQSTTESRTYTSIPSSSLVGLTDNNGFENIAFPLGNPAEVRLMKYYLEKMCHWFDICDNQKHFALEVPRRAITCPTLLNAIFALSSRHLSMGERFDQYAADRYQQECLNQLLAMDPSSLANDDLLAATILLRTLEEMDGMILLRSPVPSRHQTLMDSIVQLIGADHELHLHGIQLFMSTMPSPSSPTVASPNQLLSPISTLRKACFWTGLRQEIVMAFVNQRPVKIKLDHPFIDRSLTGPATDDTWANRIVIHCAHVLQFCFGGDAANGAVDKWRRLKEYDEAWLNARPLSWLPLAYAEPDRGKGEVFPTMLYLSSAIISGNTHAIFARALLMCYDPTIPKIGPGQKLAQRKLDAEIRNQIRELCATALSNRATVPAMFTASMGVTMCGDRFTDDRERGGLLDLLIKTEAEHFWPTGGAQDHLKKAWGWAVE
ncbi:putative ARCA protein [Seiridium unicorne]|uniref:ARCA protein n=1 Tax=Seiridium unicorne TaxID=138068 RepID=A0ABR2V684_9PEZI